MIENKLCIGCSIIKSIKWFAKNKNTKDGLQDWCKSCYKKYRENPSNWEIIKQKKDEYMKIYEKTPERVQKRKEHEQTIEYKEKRKDFYNKNKEAILFKNNVYRINNNDDIKIKKKLSYQKNKEKISKKNLTNYGIVIHLRAGAKKRNIEFDLTEEDIEEIRTDICPIFGTNFIPYHKHLAASIDRIDNRKGYVKGNIWMISILANRIKNDLSKEELKLYINKMKEWVDTL